MGKAVRSYMFIHVRPESHIEVTLTVRSFLFWICLCASRVTAVCDWYLATMGSTLYVGSVAFGILFSLCSLVELCASIEVWFSVDNLLEFQDVCTISLLPRGSCSGKTSATLPKVALCVLSSGRNHTPMMFRIGKANIGEFQESEVYLSMSCS